MKLSNKIILASEIISAMRFLGINTERFAELREKYTLQGLHEKLAALLNGETITL